MQNKVPKLQNINSFGSVITPLFLPPNGYTHHPLNVKSHCPPHIENVMLKPSHSPQFSETVGNLHGIQLWDRKREQVGLKKKGRLHMQNKSVDGSSLLGHYGMNHTPVHAT